MNASKVPTQLSAQERLVRANLLVERHHELLFRYAFRMTGCRAAAEDIVQEAFLRAFRALEQLRDELAERGWLLTITRNEFSRWCRKKAQQKIIRAETEETADKEETEEQEVERQDWVKAAMDQLPLEFRTVVLMYYFEHLSYAEIAEQLRLPIGTVMSRLSRAKNHLRRCLDELALPH
jgi:RNA polymerase sigma-70 factor, ECF subfamily